MAAVAPAASAVSTAASATTLADVLRRHARERPEQQAYVFLDGDGVERERLTYGELDARARALSAWLQQAGARGERALLMYPPGLEFVAAFFACLYAGVTAVPVHPPRSRRHLGRLHTIVEDASPALVLTQTSFASRLDPGQPPFPTAASLSWMNTDELVAAMDPPASVGPGADPGDLAFLQYTSGSTALPKGVMVRHGNLLHNVDLIHRAISSSPDSVLVSWLPIYHDLGLIGQILQAAYLGARCILMAPATFVQRPLRWLEAISRYRGTVSGGPNFAYELCLQHSTAEERARLDLSSWKTAFSGAEPVRAHTLERFAGAFAPSGFRRSALYPCYGLAEATLMVTGAAGERPPRIEGFDPGSLERGCATPAPESRLRLVSCGAPCADLDLRIVDPDSGRPCPEGQVGEVWVAGPSVTGGYWNRPEATAEAFAARLDGDGPFLRTGDLGFLHRGELFVTGRIKDLILLRGRNLYPQDVELTVERSHPALVSGGGAAFALAGEDEEQLAIVHELDRRGQVDAEEVVRAIRQAVVEEHEVQPATIVLLRAQTLPKTTSGKVQRRACRQALLDGQLHVVHRWPAPSSRPVAAAAVAGSAERAQEAIAWLRAYARTRFSSRLMDERRSISPHVVLDFGNRGLLGLQAPLAAGGLELGAADALRVFEQLAAVDLTLAALVSAHNGLGLRPLQVHGREPLRGQLLPRLASGRELGSLALTEEGAGSNPWALETTATPDGQGGWRLRGTKVWSGSSSWAGVIHVFARHRDDGPLAGRLSAFAVPQDSPGLHHGPEALTLGLRGMVQNAVCLEDVAVGPGQLLGEAGEGMEVAQEVFRFARLGIGALSLGGIKRCAQLMLRYAERRTVATGRLLDNPVTRARLGELTAAATALEALVFRVAAGVDQGQAIATEASIACKVLGSELLWRAADDLVQLLGGRGYIESNLAPQILRDARVLRIFEGPTEPLTIFVGTRATQEASRLEAVIGQQLAAPEVARQLRELILELRPEPGQGSPEERPWLHYLLGDAACWALLWAAVEGAEPGRLAADEREDAATFARQRFHQARARARELAPQAAQLPQPSRLAARIAAYEQAIGDVEQQHAGEDHSLDRLLRQAPTHIQAPPPTPAPPPPSTPEPDAPALALERWLGQWLITRAEVAPESLDATKPFASYGLDSVTAVLLVADLEAHLQRQLSPELAWAYPTIRDMAQFLAAGEGS